MFLLVIGLVAVIIAVVVGIFLTRRRRDDEDEPGGRQTVRDRLSSRGREGRLRTDPRMARNPASRGPAPSRRPAGEPRGYGGPGRGYEPAGFDQSRGYEPSPRGYGERPARSRDDQRTERIPAARRNGRYQDAPEPATPVGARASRGAAAPRRGAVGTDTGPGDALYDTGPSAADFTATRISADPDLADSDVFPRVRAEIPETEAKPRPKNQAKGRGRPSRGRHDDDDDDWPSTEWDKLSDEQYWAELSADKPLATTARTAQPSSSRPGGQRPRNHAGPPPRPRRRPGAPHPGPSPRRTPSRRARPAAASRPPDRPERTAAPSGRTPAGGRRGHRPGRPGLAERPAARPRVPSGCRSAAGASPLPTRCRIARPSPARRRTCPQPPRLHAARTDDDPLTSPHFARGGAGRRTAAPTGPPGATRARGRTASGRPGLPERAERLPSAAEAYPAGYLPVGRLPGLLRRLPGHRPGGYPAPPAATRPPGAERHRSSHQPRRASPQQRAPPAAQARRQARDSYAWLGATTAIGGTPTRPAATSPIRARPRAAGAIRRPAAGTAIRPPRLTAPTRGVPPGPGSIADRPRPSRTDPPRTSPGRRRGRSPARPRPARPSRARPRPARRRARPPAPGYPASPAAPAPGWGSDRSADRRGALGAGGPGQPVRQLRGHHPAGRDTRPSSGRAHARPAPARFPVSSLASPGGRRQQLPGYTTGPTAAYSDPYSSGSRRRPGRLPGQWPAGQWPATGRRQPG